MQIWHHQHLYGRLRIILNMIKYISTILSYNKNIENCILRYIVNKFCYIRATASVLSRDETSDKGVHVRIFVFVVTPFLRLDMSITNLYW